MTDETNNADLIEKTPEEIEALQQSFMTQGAEPAVQEALGFVPPTAPVQERLEEFMMLNAPAIDQMPMLSMKVQKLPHYEGLPELKRATLHSSGIDLYAAIDSEDTILLNSIGATHLIPTGIKVEVPVGYEIQIRPRSGLAAKQGITVLNSPGTIDADYRGEIFVILTKLTTGKFKVRRGERIAQMVLVPVVYPNLVYVDELSDTSRGEGGFGHSGT